MANRQNLLEADFGVQRKDDPTTTATASPSGSQASEKKFTDVGTSFFAKGQVMKPRQLIFVCGIAGMLGWISVFGVGMLVNSKVYRDQLATNFDFAILAEHDLLRFTFGHGEFLAVHLEIVLPLEGELLQLLFDLGVNGFVLRIG